MAHGTIKLAAAAPPPEDTILVELTRRERFALMCLLELAAESASTYERYAPRSHSSYWVAQRDEARELSDKLNGAC